MPSFFRSRALDWRGAPSTDKTVIRAGFGMYNDLQDALGYRTDQNAPFNPTYSITAQAVSGLPIDPSAALPSGALLVPGGVQPDMETPTLISCSLRVQQELSPNTSLTLGYVGSHGYHEIIGVDANEPFPVVCPASPCPATYPATFPAALAGTPVSSGIVLRSNGSEGKSGDREYLDVVLAGNSNYNALQVDVNRRFSHGMSFRGVYTWSKALDDGDSVNAHRRSERARAGVESIRLPCGLGTCHLRRAAHRRSLVACIGCHLATDKRLAEAWRVGGMWLRADGL